MDAAAFVGGLAAAWFSDWNTTDLVWSLWLASLIVGYSILVWSLSGSLREHAGAVVREEVPFAQWVGGAVLLTLGLLVGLAFFTVHFGGFHFVHSVFLDKFFPLDPGAHKPAEFPGWSTYREVFGRYWIFLPVAFLAERGAFTSAERRPPGSEVTAAAIEARKRSEGNSGLMAPYRNVIRMQLLIFFFVGAHFAHLDNFAVYAVVYAVYFFPWRIFRRENRPASIAVS
ncbi:MAG: DUF6498-containing protein [Opitutus sp.]